MNDKIKFAVAVFVIALCAYYCVPYGIGAEVTPQTESIDMDIKTGGIRSEPMVEAPAIEKKVEQEKREAVAPSEVTKAAVVFERADAGAKPGEATWKEALKGGKQNMKRVGRGMKLWKAQTWKDNWNDTWNFMENNKGKIAASNNLVGTAWYASKFGIR